MSTRGYREAVVVRKIALMLSSIFDRKLILVCRVQHGGSANADAMHRSIMVLLGASGQPRDPRLA